MQNYPLASSTWDNKELDAIQGVVKNGIFTMGEKVAECERDFAAFIGSKYAVMTSSGSTANLIATAALFYTKNPKLKRGDEVIVPAVSWSTTYYPLYQYGLKLKFVDINLHTLNYDLGALKEAISEQTKMIMCVNLLGNPNDFSTIFKLIEGKNIIVLEDNCESMGAEFEGKQAGTFGVMGTFSTFYSHHIATMEGGFVITDDEELYHILLCLRAHGWTRNLPKDNAKIFQKYFANHPDFIIQKEIGSSSWFGFSLIIKPDSALTRKEVIQKLEANNIEYRPIVTGDFTQNEVMKYF
ncbi:DegT/DnrJ/EryC1/StrS family aminotransferase, partial [Helicobacter ganmani]|uniref:DegT/DnrJ/EryC1/StrS family aminotransferase n=1 Tax=Helicobacter ganmani TaxID=60246 RepID=UPI003A85DFCB